MMTMITSTAGSYDLALQRSHGTAMIRFDVQEGRSALVQRYSSAPMRILAPRPTKGVPEAVLANLAGGIAGGDRCEIGVAAGPGAKAVVSTQAAEKVYRAIDAPAEWMTRLTLAPGAALEWMPQETILFDGARLKRRTEVDLADDAQFLAVETLVFGRAAHGERIVNCDLAERWQIDRNGRPVWRDVLRIKDGAFESAIMAGAGLRGSSVSATLIYIAPDAPEHLDEIRMLLSNVSAFSGASTVRGLVAARFLAPEAGKFKRELTELLGRFRAMVFGRPALPPRVWLC